MNLLCFINNTLQLFLWINKQLVQITRNLILIDLDSDPSMNFVLVVASFMAW